MKNPAALHDVLIIGAGPAGSLASAALARQARSVVCVERDYFPRPVIGESLLPRCNELLDRVGLLDAVERRQYTVKRAATFVRGSERERILFADGLPGDRPTTFQVPRDDFDLTLAMAARQLGADIRFGQNVDQIAIEEDRAVADVTDRESGATSQLAARFILDCSGSGRVLPRLFGHDSTVHDADRVACFCHVESDDRPADDGAGDIWVCAHPENGWAWIIPFSNGRTSVGVISDREVWDRRGGSPRARLFEFLNEEPNAGRRLARAVPVTPCVEVRRYAGRSPVLHGPRWAIAGNSAGFIDPVFSSGVCLALETATLASTLIDRTLAGDPVDWNSEYDAAVNHAFHVFREFVESWYRRDLELIVFSAARLDRIRRFIVSILGGNVLRPDNPIAVNPRAGLGQLAQVVAQAADGSTN